MRQIPTNFRRLDVYQTAICFLPLSTEIADRLPPRYSAIADQLRRAALSIPLNIAEGSGKTSGPDQRRHYSIAHLCSSDALKTLPALNQRPKSEHFPEPPTWTWTWSWSWTAFLILPGLKNKKVGSRFLAHCRLTTDNYRLTTANCRSLRSGCSADRQCCSNCCS